MTYADEPLEVTERASRPLPRATYRALEDSPDFLQLIDSGVVSLARTKRHGFTLTAGPYVGEALLDNGTRIQIKEKSTGSLASLVKWALPRDVRIAEAPAPVAPESSVLAIFVERLLDHVGGYLRNGRLKEYVSRRQLSASPRGRIDIRNTAMIMARGNPGRIAHTRSALSADLLVNQLLARALTAADAYASARDAEGVRTRTRGLATLFEDVSAHQFERMPANRLREAFDRAQSDQRVNGDLRSALAYAQALLLHWGAWTDTPVGTVPQSFFLKLETLFEDAVRSILAANVLHDVGAGTSFERFVFADNQDSFAADPDLVVGPPPAPCLVGDCKYKNVGSGPGHSDLYQLLVHAETFGAPRAALVYPGDLSRTTYLGKARSSSISVSWSEVRLPHLVEDVLAMANALGLELEPDVHAAVGAAA